MKVLNKSVVRRLKIQMPEDVFARFLGGEVPARVLEEALRIADELEKEQDFRDEQEQLRRPL